MTPTPAEPIRVLLIDDEPDFLEAISFWLASKRCHVTTAATGEKGLELIKTFPFDVVFLDVVMPRVDGLEALRRIRAFSKTLPVILVTASPGSDNQFAGARALGISGLFPKGGSLEQLSEVLDVALRMIRRSSPSSDQSSAGFSRDRAPLRKTGLDAFRGFLKRLIPPHPR